MNTVYKVSGGVNELYKNDKEFYNLTKEEQNERINNYTK